MSTYGFAIVGCGVIAPRHARAIAELPDAQLGVVMDTRVEIAKAFGREYNCGYTDDLDEVLQRADVDVVCVCVPNGLHAAIGERVAQAGKHLVVEKPLEVSLSAADRLIAACDEAGIKLTVIYPRRFTPDGKRLRSLVESGRLGPIVLADLAVKLYRSQAYWDSGAWRGTADLDGGTLLNQGAHGLDLMQSVLGPVATVTGRARTAVHPIAAPDIELGVLTFASGAVATVTATTAAYPGLGERLEITGTKGSVLMDRSRIVASHLQDELGELPAHGMRIAPATPPPSETPSHESHRQQIADILLAVRDDRDPIVTGLDGRHVIEIVAALHESSRTGHSVSVDAIRAPAGTP